MQTPTSTIIKTGDLGGHKVAMQIDASAMAHIMSILTDLYSDPEAAVIREYSTNALDAHVEAGNKAPIEVFTPTALSPYFIVRDFGVGLSKADIENIYSQYGASTKRGTNEQVGMLGLGAKSALTLVPQFTVTSVKYGERIVVSVSRDNDGSGQMEIIATDFDPRLPNGTEIKIPVPRSHNFAAKCRHFFKFWTPGTVLVDGKAPEHIQGRPVGDTFIIDESLDRDYVVMGNVAYPVKESLYRECSTWQRLGIVAFVNIGDVNFTPSREELHYTPQTKATIRRLQDKFADGLVQSARKDVEEAPTFADAWKRARLWRTKFYGRLGDFHYKGHKVPSEIPFEKDAPGKEYSIIEGSRGRRTAQWVRAVNPSMLDSYIFVTGFASGLKMSPIQRQRARIYAQQQGWSATKVALFTEDEIITDATHLKFLESIKIVPWADIAKIKIERPKGVSRKNAEPYELYTGKYNYDLASTLDTSRDIIYISPVENKHPSHLIKMYPDAQIVMLGMNRWEKFKRDWPTAVHYQAKVAADRAALITQFTYADKVLWTCEGWGRRNILSLDEARIEDPELAMYIGIVRKGEFSPAAKKYREVHSTYAPIDEPVNPLTKYPLAANLSSVDTEHAHWYINSYYRQIADKKGN